ncbi:MAG: ABC transporter permease [Thermoleophilaceae bacterium]|nr:ABC transporter permease [Thermoleophilaceae bacterium]
MRAGRWLLDQSLNVFSGLVIVYLLAPIAVIIWFSFNDTHSRFNFVWQGFTLKHWKDPFGVPGLLDALKVSIEIAALSTVIATALGTMMALALVRYQFRARGATNFFIFLPLATPEIVLGASLLSLFLSLGVNTGFNTILIAHVMFNISFVVVTVRSRLIGFDRSLEEAAQDLGANSIQTFVRVTLPLIAPGVLAAALLAFALSIDDFVITNFNSGSTVTYPLFIWGAARVSIPPQVNIVATMMFVVTLIAAVLTVLQQLRAEKIASVRPEQEAV